MNETVAGYPSSHRKQSPHNRGTVGLLDELLLPVLLCELWLDSDDRDDSLLRLDSLCDRDDSDCELWLDSDDRLDSLCEPESDDRLDSLLRLDSDSLDRLDSDRDDSEAADWLDELELLPGQHGQSWYTTA